MLAAVFDTETTGLIKNKAIPLHRQPRVIEFFGQLIDPATGAVEGELEFLANPGFQLEKIITTITGLRDEDLKDCPDFEIQGPLVQDFFAQAGVVVAHNLSFDIDIVNFEFQRMETVFDWPANRLCTVEATEHYKGRRLKLAELHEHLFGEGFEGAHRGRADVEALARIYIELVARGDA